MPTIVSLLEERVRSSKSNVAVRDLNGQSFTYGDIWRNSNRVASYLAANRLKRGDNIGLISGNEPSFLFGDLGILRLGATSVLINQALEPRELLLEYVRHTNVAAILAADRFIGATVDAVQSSVPVLSLEQCMQCTPSFINEEISEDDPATVIFSSGTSAKTARSFKAVVLTHGNIASNILAVRHLDDVMPEGPYMTGIADQWHSFEYMVQKTMMFLGRELYFGNKVNIAKSACTINPAAMIMVPRMANLTMEAITRDIRKNKGDKVANMFLDFIDASSQYLMHTVNEGRIDILGYLRHTAGEMLCYRKVREGLKKRFGENRVFLIGGSAPLDIKTQLFFAAIGLPIYQGFGLTETSPVISVNMPPLRGNYKFGSSGKVIPGVAVKILDPDTLAEMPTGREGAIYVMGPNVFHSYYGDPELTAQVKRQIPGSNGIWFNTEDAGTLDEKGYLSITGRLKRLIVLENGNKVNPVPIETEYENKGHVSRLVCVGEGKKYVAAIVIPKKSSLEEIAAGSLTRERMEAEIMQMLTARDYGKDVDLSKLAVDYGFDEANIQFVTPGTMKLRFAIYLDSRKELIDGLYRRVQ